VTTTNSTTSCSKRDAAQFAARVRLLALYVTEHGKNPIQKYVTPCGFHLGNWVSKQRALYNAADPTLTAADIAALEAAGIIWKARRGRPPAPIAAQVAEFKAVTGDANAPTGADTESGAPVGYSLRNAHRANERGSLSETTRNDLLALGVDLPAPGVKVDRHRAGRQRRAEIEFAEKIAGLDLWRAANDGAWPSKGETSGTWRIGQWLVEVRGARRAGTLSPEREAMFDERGIDWNPTGGRKDFDATFAARLACLTAFRDEEGHAAAPSKKQCTHPQCATKDIGQWVHRQRKKQKAGKMSAAHIEALDALGFVWDASAYPRAA
jgi:hypothetical protein